MLQTAGWAIAAHHSQHATTDAARTVLLDPAGSTIPGVSNQAVRAIRLAASLPGTTSRGIHVTDHGAVPAGPFIVQHTEVLNQNMSDEGADVEVGSLLDPITGQVIAAWFWGL